MTKTFHPHLADNLRSLMNRRGLSQTELGNLVNVSPQKIWNWLNRLNEPSLSQVEELATALKTTSGKLLAKPKG